MMAAEIKSAHQTVPILRGRAPGMRLGVREHCWVSPGLPTGLSASLLGSHAALYFQVNAPPLLAASPSTFAIWMTLQPHGRGLFGHCLLDARAGEAKQAVLDPRLH